MGLDMFAWTTAATTPAVDFPEPEDAKLLHHWRKHPNLHGWMFAHYRRCRGTNEDFTLVPVVLTADALDRLEKDVRRNRLPHTEGFFFGRSTGNEKADDLAFIAKARAAIKRGLTVYYTAW